MRFAFPSTIGDQSFCDPDRLRLTPILSDRARISFTNPHEVDGVLFWDWGHFSSCRSHSPSGRAGWGLGTRII